MRPQLTDDLQENFLFSFYHIVVRRYRHIQADQTFTLKIRSTVESLSNKTAKFSIEQDSERSGIPLPYPLNLEPNEEMEIEEAVELVNIPGNESESPQDSDSEDYPITFKDPHLTLDRIPKRNSTTPNQTSFKMLEIGSEI